MAIRVYKPITAGTRQRSVLTSEEITKSTPEKSLTVTKKKTNGRNNQGKITVRHRGGGVKRKYRLIDFKRRKDGVTALVSAIEYDPNRSANIALLNYKDGSKAYILAPKELKVGDIVESGEKVDIKVGNAMPIMNIPVGTVIHNIELRPKKGGAFEVMVVYATDGLNKRANLTVLEDDRSFFPEYNGAFLVRNDLFERFSASAPDLEEVLELLTGRVDNEAMVALTYAVDVEGKTVDQAAHDFLAEQGLLTS